MQTQKIEFLYHASPDPNIRILEPRANTVRDTQEGPVVFATPSLACAMLFMGEENDSRSSKGAFNNVFYNIISDQERFIKNDKGGTIYTLAKEGFVMEPGKGMGPYERVSRTSVVPISKKTYASYLEAMLDTGIQVYFVSPKILQDIQHANDHGFSILQTLQSENQKRDINCIPFK